MQKSTFGLLVTVISLLSPISAFAQDQQLVIQGNQNTGVADGYGNVVQQVTGQSADQYQLDVNGYPVYDPSSQTAVQNNANQGAGIGVYNVIDQGTLQNVGQTNVDTNYYPY